MRSVLGRRSAVILGLRSEVDTLGLRSRVNRKSAASFCLLFCLQEMAKKSHHFQGLKQYEDKLMDLAEGKPAFCGRGQKPSNKQVIAAIANIKRCQQGSFFTSSASSKQCSCSCGWHLKAAARKKVRYYFSCLLIMLIISVF